MNELADKLAAATLRQIEQSDGKLTRETLSMIRRTGDFARCTDGTCGEVKKLAVRLRDYAAKIVENEKGPGLSGWTGEVLSILEYGFSHYLS